MTYNIPWTGLTLVCCLAGAQLLAAQTEPSHSPALEDDIPDQQLLEFIADMDITDDETFDLLIYHGKEDLEKNDEPTSKQEPDHEM